MRVTFLPTYGGGMKIGLMRVAVTAIAVVVSGQAMAQQLRADPGQPFCKNEKDLMAYVVSAMTKDRSIEYDCHFLEEGEVLTVVEVTSEGAAATTFRARVKDRSGVGWSIQVKK